MGAETRVRGWGRRALAMFEVFALVALLGLHGAAAGSAVAGKNEDRRARPDVEQDCPAAEGLEAQADHPSGSEPDRPSGSEPDHQEPDEGEQPVTGADICEEEADAELDDDEARDREADEPEDHHADDDEAEDHSGESGEQSGESGESEEQSGESEEPDGHDTDESGRDPDEPADELESDEPAEAEQSDVEDQPDQEAEPEGGSDEGPEDPIDEDPALAETDPEQGGGSTGTDDDASPDSQSSTGEGGGPSRNGYQDTDSQDAGQDGSQTGGPGPAGKEPNADASRRGHGDAGGEEAHDIDPAPMAAADPISGYSLTGSFSTAGLLDALPSQRILSTRKRVPEVAPFIIAGPASWTDTWGAPRFGPGSLRRQHEGQDVFCRYGDPVLASERGYVEFDEGGLGGKVARLHRPDGSYWYYAHLSAWNERDLISGDSVVPGDVIGYCGNSGNAIGSPPHVHFGLYRSDGEAINPVSDLVRWLRTAERKLGLEPIKGRNTNRDASRYPVLKGSSGPILMQRLPRLDGTADAFGDARADLESARNQQLLASSSVPLEAALASVAAVTLLLWGFLAREALS